MAAFANVINRLAVPAGVALFAAGQALYDCPGGQRVVLFDRVRGVNPAAVGEGTHFLVPFLQRPIHFDVRIKPRNITTQTGSRDLQQVSLTLRVLSRPDVRQLPQIYQSLGLDYDERVLPSIGNEVLKAIVAQFDAAELITQREVVSARIREDLLKRASEFGIILEDVSIVSWPEDSCFSIALGPNRSANPFHLRYTDTPHLRTRIHKGSRTQADRTARSREGEIHRRAGRAGATGIGHSRRG